MTTSRAHRALAEHRALDASGVDRGAPRPRCGRHGLRGARGDLRAASTRRAGAIALALAIPAPPAHAAAHAIAAASAPHPTTHLCAIAVRPHPPSTSARATGAPDSLEAWRRDTEAWHARRVARLTAPDGWLTLVGLHELAPGEHTIGSAADNAIVVPRPVPAHVGVLRVDSTGVVLAPAPGVTLRAGGTLVRAPVRLRDDSGDRATVVDFGPVHLHVISRAGRRYLRVRDENARARRDFRGIERFPVDPRWRVVGRWEPYDPPRRIRVPNVLGTAFDAVCRGAVVFELDGVPCRLEPMEMDADGMFIVFGDSTSGVETYGGGRFLDAPPPDATGRVLLDFNRAYNPPCAFTPWATCPLPHPANRLKVAVRAGEKKYRDTHHPAR